jgi:lipopolysaccharide transport system ATP-binding protein
MSSNNANAISIRGLSKAYTIAHSALVHPTFADVLMHRLRHPFARATTETFWALKDISFDINKGEVVGIIGRNGAGKSTLLKILSRITEPTAGRIEVTGRVGSLLEVGTGFHPELTGRENIYLNGSILGMRHREIDRQFEAIVDFAGVEKFLDTPVKRYSSGMYVRLAFAVAAHLNPDTLVVDEVLAVGDAAFQEKCLGKMGEVARSGRTVLLVSHNMAAVRHLCTQAILLSDGQLAASGKVEEVVPQYLAVRSTRAATTGTINRHGLALDALELRTAGSESATDCALFNDDYELSITVRAAHPVYGGGVVVRVRDSLGTLVSSACTVEEGLGTIDFTSLHTIAFNLPRLQLLPGRYFVSVYIYKPNDAIKYLEAEDAMSFDVQSAVVRGGGRPYVREHGLVRIVDGGSVRHENTVAHRQEAMR